MRLIVSIDRTDPAAPCGAAHVSQRQGRHPAPTWYSSAWPMRWACSRPSSTARSWRSTTPADRLRSPPAAHARHQPPPGHAVSLRRARRPAAVRCAGPIAGHDVCDLPLHDRRRLLADAGRTGPALAGAGPAPLWLSPAQLRHRTRPRGRDRQAGRLQYRPSAAAPRSGSRVKVRRRQEFVVGGWAPGEGGRAAGCIGGLLVGYHDAAVAAPCATPDGWAAVSPFLDRRPRRPLRRYHPAGPLSVRPAPSGVAQPRCGLGRTDPRRRGPRSPSGPARGGCATPPTPDGAPTSTPSTVTATP